MNNRMLLPVDSAKPIQIESVKSRTLDKAKNAEDPTRSELINKYKFDILVFCI